MGNLNKTEKELLRESRNNKKLDLEKELRPLEEGETFYYDEKTKKFSIIKKGKNQKKKDIDRTEEYFDFMQGKKDEGYKVMEAAKGGEVKKYMGGGSVHKNKKNMITTRGWGASRKT
jgi:hypothetical protein